MAFPSVQGTPGTNNGTATTIVVNLPASIAAGELLLAFVALSHTIAATVTPPGDWNTVYDSIGNGNQRRSACYWKLADGAEGASFNVTASASTAWATVAYRINAWDSGTAPESGTLVAAAGTNPNPPNLAPSWGAADTLWFVYAGRNTNNGSPSAPTNYSNFQNANRTGVSCLTAERQLNAASEDPGTFTATTSSNGANTVAVKPVTAVAPPPFRRRTHFFTRAFYRPEPKMLELPRPRSLILPNSYKRAA